MNKSALQDALDLVETLPDGEQELLLEIIARRRMDRRRVEIGRNAQETLQAVKEGKARYGSLDDLKRDLLSDE